MKCFWGILMGIGYLYGSAAFTPIEDTAQLAIKNPALQSQTTGKIRLANGMHVYLVSDPSVEQSACALGVRTGSWHDPDKWPGMAHLLEHMLFLGTKRYPQNNGFASFLSDHSGLSNAFTAPHCTVYMFSVGTRYLSEGMERFSDFFIDPLLDTAQISAELMNVDQEFQKNRLNDRWREYQVFKELCQTGHPHRKFSTGHRGTLKDVTQEELQNWFLQHYSPQQMCLVVYAPESIDQLTSLVVDTFGKVPKRPLPSKKDLPNLFAPTTAPKCTYIEPVKDLDILRARWEFPKEFLQDPSKALDVIAYALGRGQKWSLEELLKQEELIEEMEIYATHTGKTSPLFCIDFSLTKKGVEEQDALITHMFSAFQGLKNSAVPLYLFEEMQEMTRLNYEYQAREKPFQFVMRHAEALLHEDFASYPEKTLLASHFDPEKMLKALSLLTPESAHFFCLTAEKRGEIDFAQKERWMGVPYRQEICSSQQVTRWKAAPLHPDIHLATPNLYIPKNLAIVPKEAPHQEPVPLVDHPSGRIFFLQDHEFSSPNVAHFLHIYSPKIDRSVRSSVLTALYLEILEKELSPTLLSAGAAGLKMALKQEKGALHLLVEGYAEKAPALLEEIIKTLALHPIDKSAFLLTKTSLSKYFANGDQDLPLYRAVELLRTFIREDTYTKQDKNKILQEISYEEFIQFRSTLFDQAYIEGFLSGNITRKDAESIWLDTISLLEPAHYEKKQPSYLSPFDSAELKGPICVEQSSPSNGTGLVLMIDQGARTAKNEAIQSILAKTLREGFFHALRTEQQTAYIATSSPAEYDEHLYQNFFVQSNTHTHLDLLYRFELFLESFLQDFSQKLGEKRFAHIQESLLAEMEKPYRNLKQKSQKYDQMAFLREGNFHYEEEKKEALRDLSYGEFQEKATAWLERKNTRRLAVACLGKLERPFAYEPVTEERLGWGVCPKPLATDMPGK
ncbi:MAG: insulinase family protein [Chlamydiota bacterium]